MFLKIGYSSLLAKYLWCSPIVATILALTLNKKKKKCNPYITNFEKYLVFNPFLPALDLRGINFQKDFLWKLISGTPLMPGGGLNFFKKINLPNNMGNQTL
jgi:hypothetical protein